MSILIILHFNFKVLVTRTHLTVSATGVICQVHSQPPGLSLGLISKSNKIYKIT